ncbi:MULTISPECIES: ABC transporter permease [unclassified Streptomyces]|uniref:ABC transporter permease n=1 Tax=unclassified Streptomyces TaxID=2593676 RepID=UPI0029A92530|nr:ABC transporter permease [Streptomyces sp. DK15]MDX2390626.1 ABC transporter permease [Streptomyces sp. DK15]
MSALTLKGPHWVTVRQHRRALWALPAAVAACLVTAVVLRASASPRGTVEPNIWYYALRSALEGAGRGMLLLPVLIAAFVAGPMLAREMESGTYRLALTQSTTPKAWLASKIGIAAVVSAACAALMVGVYRLGWAPVSGTYQLSWADRGTYEATGPVIVAYCLLGVGVGAVVGQWIRRTLPALLVAGAVTGLVVVVFGFLRWSVLTPVTITTPLTGRPEMGMPRSAFLVEAGLLKGTGERVPSWGCTTPSGELGSCVQDLQVTGRYVDYHPYAHYWLTQLIETAVVLALAALALHAAFRVLRSRRG